MDRRAVLELADRHERFAGGRIHLADVAATAQAVVAFAAVGRVGDEHAIARPHALDRRPDGVDHADAAVAENARRHRTAGPADAAPCRAPG